MVDGARVPLPVCSRIGPLEKSLRLETAGVLRCASIRLQPWSVGTVLGAVPASSAFGSCDAFEAVADHVVCALRSGDWPAIWRTFDVALSAQRGAGRRAEAVVRAIIARDAASAEEVGREHGLGRRQVERTVREATRLSPKQLASLARFERARDALFARPDVPLARLAAAVGFADQAHFTREFKRYAGRTPRAFAAEARRVRAWHVLRGR